MAKKAEKPKNAALEILRELRENLDALRKEATAADLSASRRKQINEQTRRIGLDIESFLRETDPIKLPPAMFDPAKPDLVGRFIALALVAQPRVPLAEVGNFYGAGVYALYYRGAHEAYRAISGKEAPIYLGKADPRSALATTPIEQETKLAGRLKEHHRNIERAAETLNINDFECRYLVVQTGWEKAAESFLINFFSPVWNSQTKICYGFGKHGDDPATRGNKRSPWDTMHAGRKWARKSTKPVEDAVPETIIRKNIAEHFKRIEESGRLYNGITDVLNAFIAGLKFSGD